MNFTTVLVEEHDGIGLIKINRPDVLNAINDEMLTELSQAIDALENNKAIKVIVITGEGKAFIAGADIEHMKDMTPLQGKAFAEKGHTLLQKMEKSPLPIIAAVNGFALGGGCELVMACDVCIASQKAKFGQPEINLGIHPGFGGTQRLPRLVGRMKAKELLFTGDVIDADEALAVGLINKVVEPESLMTEALAMAEKIVHKPAVPVEFMKELVNMGLEIDLSTASALETLHFATCFSTHDQSEGMAAFLDKRKARFEDR
jgi:enoyl-CoA hydratase